MSYEYIPIHTDEKTIREIAELLRLVFPGSKKYSEAYIKWQYLKNPAGKVVGYNAYLDKQLVAHYVMIPVTAELFGRPEPGLLSLNTATRPGHEGKKLFTTLAELSYRAAASEGYGFVVGVANANSSHGFISKLGFSLVGPLAAKIGFGDPIRKQGEHKFDFKLNRDKALEWRLENPSASYKIKANTIYSATDKFGIEAILSENVSLGDNTVSLGFRPVKLWLGSDATVDWSRCRYFDVPAFLRPSPLNLIFKDLSGGQRKLNMEKVCFNAFDFDAY